MARRKDYREFIDENYRGLEKYRCDVLIEREWGMDQVKNTGEVGSTAQRLRYRCPFCRQERDTLVITPFPTSPAGGKWYCHSCKFGGDSIELIRRKWKMERKECIKEIGRKAKKGEL